MADSEALLAFVFAYTEDSSRGGVITYGLGLEDGRLRRRTRMPAEAASFFAFYPEGRHLYAVSDGTVRAVRIDDSRGELTELNRQSIEGAGPCYVSVDASGRYAFVANYEGGSVSMLPLGEDRRLEEASDAVRHERSSVDPDRQDVPHPHSIGPGPKNRFVYVPDLGTDRIAIYRIDFETGALHPADTPFVELHEGAGPRHFEFHPDGRYAYVIRSSETGCWSSRAGAVEA